MKSQNDIPLRHCFKVLSGSTPKSGEGFYWDGDINWVTPEDLSNLKDGYRLYETRRKITQDGYDDTGVTLVPENSIVLTKRAPIGLLAILGVEACSNQGCFLLVPKNEIIPEFYYYFLFANKDYLQILGRGSTFMELSLDDIKSFKVPLYSQQKQKKIADFLDRETEQIDSLIKFKENQLKLLSEKRQSLITQAVTKGLNSEIRFKDSGIDWIGLIPEHWIIPQLKYISKIPLQYGANEAALDENPNNPRFVRITDIDENGNLRPETFKSLEYKIAEPFLLEDGDLLFARSGATVGKSFMYQNSWGTACFAGYLIRMRCDKRKVLPKFLNFITQSNYYWDQVNAGLIQATIQNFSGEKYGAMKILLPPLFEQEEIVTYLENEMQTFELIKQKTILSIEYLKEKRETLISSTVTDQLEIENLNDY